MSLSHSWLRATPAATLLSPGELQAPEKRSGCEQSSLTSPGVPAEAETGFTSGIQHQRLCHPALSQIFSQREDKPCMFRCHRDWTMQETPGLQTWSVTGQVTRWKRKLRHTQTTTSGLSRVGVQPYKLP